MLAWRTNRASSPWNQAAAHRSIVACATQILDFSQPLNDLYGSFCAGVANDTSYDTGPQSRQYGSTGLKLQLPVTNYKCHQDLLSSLPGGRIVPVASRIRRLLSIAWPPPPAAPAKTLPFPSTQVAGSNRPQCSRHLQCVRGARPHSHRSRVRREALANAEACRIAHRDLQWKSLQALLSAHTAARLGCRRPPTCPVDSCTEILRQAEEKGQKGAPLLHLLSL